jgi:hypothetical protein
MVRTHRSQAPSRRANGGGVGTPTERCAAEVTDISEEYEDARGAAMTLPTWVLRLWERRATRRQSHGAPPAREQARLLAVRAVLREREPAA